MARSKIKSRSHHDVAYLHTLTNVPTKYQLPTPYAVLILEILKCGGSSPLCPKNVGAWSIKMGTCTSAKEGLILEAFVCPYVY